MNANDSVIKNRPIYQFVVWTAHHPMIFASIVVLMTSLVGYVYESSLFAGFDINIFRFSSVYDFMYQWWRQWAVVSHFFVILLMISGVVAGYYISAFVIDSLSQYRKVKGKISLEERFSSGTNKTPFRNSSIFILSVISLVGVSYLIVDINEDVIAGKRILLATIYAILYGVVSFCSVWLSRNLIIKECFLPVWRWTGISLLIIGVIYLFIVMLMNIHQLANTEARLIKGDTKYTYTVIRNDGNSDVIVSRNAKILAITTYYHLFYVRETGKIVAVSNQFVGSIESNWVR